MGETVIRTQLVLSMALDSSCGDGANCFKVQLIGKSIGPYLKDQELWENKENKSLFKRAGIMGEVKGISQCLKEQELWKNKENGSV